MKKILISLLSVMLTSVMAFSTTAFAQNYRSYYSINNLPYDFEKKPQQEQELSSEVKEEILIKLLETEYPDSNPEDIVIRYYGTLSNGAMLINHYNKTYTYTDTKIASTIKYENLSFCYTVSTKLDVVNLYINGEFYTIEEAHDNDLINFRNLWEIENTIDKFLFYITDMGIENSVLIGDVDKDGRLTVTDATLIQKYLAGETNFDEFEFNTADISQDNNVDIMDATQLQKAILKIY